MLEDGETEDFGWVAAAETLLSDAKASAADLPARLALLPAAPGADGTERRRDIVRCAFTGLVTVGRYRLARRLSAAETRDRETETSLAPGPLSASRRDMLFGQAMLKLQAGGDPASARPLFARVCAALAAEGPPVPDLFWASLRSEALAVERREGAGAARAPLVSSLASLGRAASEAHRISPRGSAPDRPPASRLPHFHTAPKASAKTGSGASISANFSTSGSSRCSGMV
nr:hypothetical protein [Rhodospirillales bacterium]